MSEQTAKTATPGKGTVGPVRLSYLTVFKSRLNPNKVPDSVEFSVTLLVPKAPSPFCPDPTAVLAKINGLVKEAGKEFFAKPPAKWDNPVKDGDAETNKDGFPKQPGYWYVRVWCKEDRPPLLIDGNKQPVSGGWQSGDWGMVNVQMFGYDKSGNQGVSGSLRAIQFLKHDEALGSGQATPDDFETVAGDPSAEYDPFSDD